MNQTIDIKPNCKRLVIDFDSKTVTQEFEAEFKDGDFCRTKNGIIFIFKDLSGGSCYKHASLLPMGLLFTDDKAWRRADIEEVINFFLMPESAKPKGRYFI